MKVKGFTFFEVIVIILIVAILVKQIVARYPGRAPTLNAQAQALLGDIRYIQSLAQTHGQRFCLKRDSATAYTLYSTTGSADSVITHPTTGVSTAPQTTFSDSNISFGTFTNLPNNVLIFDATGTPYSNATNSDCFGGGVSAIATDATIPLTSGTSTCTITITVATGMGAVVCT